jgi:hypothetical protein
VGDRGIPEEKKRNKIDPTQREGDLNGRQNDNTDGWSGQGKVLEEKG